MPRGVPTGDHYCGSIDVNELKFHLRPSIVRVCVSHTDDYLLTDPLKVSISPHIRKSHTGGDMVLSFPKKKELSVMVVLVANLSVCKVDAGSAE